MKNMSIKQLLGLLTCSAALVLSGCGGGGGATVAPSETAPIVQPVGSFTVGGTILGMSGPVTLAVNGTTLVVPLSAPGGAFTFPSVFLSSGDGYVVSIAAESVGANNPVRDRCTVANNGFGTIGNNNVTNVYVVCGRGEHAVFVTDGSTIGSVTSFTINASSGQLTNTGKVGVATTGLGTNDVVTDGLGNFAYVLTTNATPFITQYDIAQTNAALGIFAANPSVTAPQSALTLVDDPLRRVVYVNDIQMAGQGVTPYKINTTTAPGTLVAQTRVQMQSNVFVDPTGKFIYSLDQSKNLITPFPINPDGSINSTSQTPIATDSAKLGPRRIFFNPNGKTAYVFSAGSTNVDQYDVGANGALVWNTMASFDVLEFPHSITFDPTGRFAYLVANNNGANAVIHQYHVAQNGKLTEFATLNVVTAGIFGQLIVDTTGRFAYWMDANSNSIFQYNIDLTTTNPLLLGSLSPMAIPSIATGGAQPSAIARR